MAVSRHVLFGKLNNTLFRAIESATAFCKLRGNPYVELAHWVNQIHQIPDSDWQRIIRHYQIDPAVLDRDIAAALAALPAGQRRDDLQAVCLSHQEVALRREILGLPKKVGRPPTLDEAGEADLWRRWKAAVVERGIAPDDEEAALELAMELAESTAQPLSVIWTSLQNGRGPGAA